MLKLLFNNRPICKKSTRTSNRSHINKEIKKKEQQIQLRKKRSKLNLIMEKMNEKVKAMSSNSKKKRRT